MSDRWGRVKTMAVTLLVHSAFTGLSGIAQTWLGLRFTGFLSGSVSAVCSAPPRRSWRRASRPHSRYGARRTQALSALGNILGSLISLRIQPGADDLLWDYSGWRVLFFVGILPSVLVVPMLPTLREPEVWRRAKAKQVARRARTSDR